MTVSVASLTWVGLSRLGSAMLPSALERARKGDRAAFGELVREHQRAVWGLCRRLLRSDAEAREVAQETFLRAWTHLDRFDTERSFATWLLSIARNLCLDTLRHQTRFPHDDVDKHSPYLQDGAPNAEDAAMTRQAHAALEGALSTLGPDDRTVLSLYYVQKQTTKQIADIMGVAPGTIMARLFRAREKLRERLQEGNPT